jgi:glycosyltransferase involved in cell wall biosynthesis
LITLHVDLGEEWRGGQNQALQLMRGLRVCGHAAELVALRDSPLARRAWAEGIPVHAVAKFIPQLLASLPLRKLAYQARFEVMHIHDAHGVTPAWLAGVHKRARLVASRRVIYPIPQNPLALARYRAVDRVVAVSGYVRETLLASGLPGEQVEVIPDGVELPSVPGREERLRARRRWGVPDGSDGPLLGYVGYFLPEKGHESLIRALPLVQKQYPDCRLLLPGEGPCRKRLEQLGVQSAVVFPGFVDEIEQVYQALDVFVFPSRAEGLGSSLLSAMSYGLPTVAVEQCAVPEVIQEGKNGLLVSEADPGDLASAILRLLSDASLSASLGAAARETIKQNFSIEHAVRRTLELYQRLCAAPEIVG